VVFWTIVVTPSTLRPAARTSSWGGDHRYRRMNVVIAAYVK
jgi:hypothetical protein